MTTQDKREADKKKLLELEAEVVRMRKALELGEGHNMLLPYPDKNNEQTVFYISEAENGKLDISETSSKNISHEHANVFIDRQDAEGYLHVINTMLLMRKCQGSVPTKDNEPQFFIELDPTATKIVITRRYVVSSKISRVSPAYETEEDANRAVRTIGKDNIISMFRIAQHIQ